MLDTATLTSDEKHRLQTILEKLPSTSMWVVEHFVKTRKISTLGH